MAADSTSWGRAVTARRVLITGATGFVGSHILESMMGDEMLVPIAACRDRQRLLPEFDGEVRIGDLRDAADRRALLTDIDIVCHAAAWTSAWSNRKASHELYYVPSLAFIEQAKAMGVKRFINVSTTSAAAPSRNQDPQQAGIARHFWPHLCNVVALEDALRGHADAGFQVVNLRLGLFVGRRYGIGLLPLLLPRLKTHLVPWVAAGSTGMPLIDGRDIGQAFVLAAKARDLSDFEGFTIVGPEIPRVREVIDFLHHETGCPRPHFSVPFSLAYAFAALMEMINPFVSWSPLVTRSIVHLLEETGASNAKATEMLGYRPQYSWREAVRIQLSEMARQSGPMAM